MTLESMSTAVEEKGNEETERDIQGRACEIVENECDGDTARWRIIEEHDRESGGQFIPLSFFSCLEEVEKQKQNKNLIIERKTAGKRQQTSLKSKIKNTLRSVLKVISRKRMRKSREFQREK